MRPDLNAVIRAAVKTAIYEYGCEVIGIRNGYDGFIDEEGLISLGIENVRGILPRGGTILGTANRGNPYARKIIRDGQEVILDVSDEIIRGIERLHMDALLVLGGDGTLHIAHELCRKGAPVIGVPKTIDNDIGGTEVTFGFDTAVNTATDAIDKLHSTAEAHHRVMVLELMGRNAGFIALHAGIAGGADVILIPEIPFRFENVVAKVRERVERGMNFSILAVSEGAKPLDGELVFSRAGDEIYTPRLGGIGNRVGEYMEQAWLRDARHGARSPPARRIPDAVRPLAGDPFWRCRRPPGKPGKIRSYGGASGRQYRGSLPGGGSCHSQAGGPPKRCGGHSPGYGDFLWG